MLNILKNTINRVFASGVDSDASAFITATGLSGTTQKSAITTLVKDLKSSGLWSKMKAVYPMVTDNYNLLSYTEDFTNAYWLKQNATVTTNSITAPNGTLTADTLIDNTTSGFHFISNPAVSLGQNGNNTVSIYAKANTLNWLCAYVYDGTTAFFTYFNLSNGTVGTNASGNTATIVDAGNGWYRCSVSRNYNATAANANCGFMTANADNVNSYAGTGKSLYIWGAQFETGSTATTYQPILGTQQSWIASQMKYNLKDPRDLDAAFRLTWSGGWTYSAAGATPNGTNAYADTKFNLVNNVPGYNNAFGVYYRTNNYGVYKLGALGASYDQGMSAHLGWQSAGSNLYNDNLGRNTIVNSAYGTFDAFHISTVTSTASQKLYRNGVLKLAGSATAGITLPSLNFYYGAANVNGTATYFDNQQWAFGILSTGLTDQDAQLLNQIVEKYQVALSRGIQAAQSFYYNSAYSNEANTYLYSTQITGTTQVSAINTLINGLKANNLWSKMKAVYPFVTDKTLQSDMAAQMKFNLVNPQDSDAAFRLAFSGGWTYSTNGAQPNGTNGYADTKLVGNTNVVKGDFGYGIYSRTQNQTSGTYGIDASLHIYPRFTDGNTYYRIFNGGGSPIVNGSSLGLIYAFNDASLNSTNWYNGVKKQTVGTSNFNIASTNLMLAGNVTGAGSYDSRQLAFAFASNALNDAEAALLYQLIQQYQTDLSRQV